MTIKEELKQKKENAMVYTVKFTGEESTRIKIREEYEAMPINGLDLLKCCAAVGFIIKNFDEIELNKEYTLEFIGIGTYIAMEVREDLYEYCTILPLRIGTAKDILGNRVFNCKINNGKVDILDDNYEIKIHETELDKVQFVKPEEFYRQGGINMNQIEEVLLKRYKRALEGLTVGDSEYYNNPERCAEDIQDRFI